MRGSRERQGAGQREIRHDAEGIQITPSIQRLRRGLLRTHELGRAEHHAGRGLPSRLAETGNSEVRHHRPPSPLVEEDVRRLDVAVDHALRVRVGERPRDFPHHPRHFARWQRAARCDPLRERSPIDVRHHDEDEAVDLLDGVNRDDVRMREPGGSTRLAHEPFAEVRVVGELRRQELDGNLTIEPHLACEVHDSHSAPAELAVKRVSADDGLLECDEQCVWRWRGHDKPLVVNQPTTNNGDRFQRTLPAQAAESPVSGRDIPHKSSSRQFGV